MAISIRAKMATVHKYYVKQMIQYAGNCAEERSRQSRKRKQADSGVCPEQICRYQDRCRGNCVFKHLEAKYLEGCRRPYRLCWAHPNCKRKGCRYVHWPSAAPEPSNKKKKDGEDDDTKVEEANTS